MKNFSLAIHGGVGPDLPIKIKARLQEATDKIADFGALLLSQGHTALDTVEMLVRLFEESPLFNAGIPGSARTREGLIELDAGIMDGRTLQFGAVTHCQQAHPISIARKLMKSRFSYRTICDLPRDLKSLLLLCHRYRIFRFVDTVGAVALDCYGDLAAAASSGGINNKAKGRISDSSVIGAGLYADNRTCAAAISGVGEDAIRRAACAQLHFRLLIPREIRKETFSNFNEAKTKAAEELREALHTVVSSFPPETAGIICVDSFGNLAAEYNTQTFILALRSFYPEGEDNLI